MSQSANKFRNMSENYPTLQSIKPLKPEFQEFKTININSEEFSVGRSLENSVVITYLSLSRKHCVFKRNKDNTWILKDCSSFGTHVNGKKLKKGKEFALSHNDLIRFDAGEELLYRFILHSDEYEPSKKKAKIDVLDNIVENVKQKFEESQCFQMEHLEKRLHNAKQMQTSSIILKQQLEQEMQMKTQQLMDGFSIQIESLRGEKCEVERQKALLEQERDVQLAAVKNEMDDKIKDLKEQIEKHNKSEALLLEENATLKERLIQEREVFMIELNKENASKQNMLEELEIKMREQEESRLLEKQALEDVLRKETEQLRIAKEQALKKLEEQMKKEQELRELELVNIKKSLEEQMQLTADEKLRAEREFNDRVGMLEKSAEEDKMKMEQLCQARLDAERKLKEAQESTEKSLNDLMAKVSEKESELAKSREQEQNLQSNEAVAALQEQLNKVKSELESVEIERSVLLENVGQAGGEGSKQSVLTEVGELMESELQCGVCAELFVTAITLNCSHTFCKYCITQWKKKKKDCPICRARITSETRSIVLDSFIEKMVQNLTDEMKEKRLHILKDREEVEAALAAATPQKRGRSTDSEQDSDEERGYIVDLSIEGAYEDEYEDDSNSESEPDYSVHRNQWRFPAYNERQSLASFNSSGSDFDASQSEQSDSSYRGSDAVGPAVAGAPAETATEDAGGSDSRPRSGRRHRAQGALQPTVEGVPGSYFGGYGRCFQCGARGHWAPGCPFT